MKQRLMLGPFLLAALIATLWLDQYLDGRLLPEWIQPWWHYALGVKRETLPPGVAILCLGLALSSIAACELATICRAGGVRVRDAWMAFCAVLGLLMFAVVPTSAGSVPAAAIVASGATAVLVGSVLLHTRRKETRGAAAAAGASLLSFIYLGLMFGFVLALRREHSAWVVLGVLVVTKSCDIGAFFTGKAIGRHKLIPWLSPGKTWEGLIGGVITSSLVAVGLLALARTTEDAGASVAHMQLWKGALAGAAIGLTGQAGDLFASVFKRDAGIKDSGKTLPGFGGILDVIDSVLLVAPVAYWTIGRL